MRLPFTILVLSAVLLLSSCASSSSDDLVEGEIQTADVIYEKAQQALDDENYTLATTYFDQVEREYPYSEWATQAQLMSAYSSYQNLDYDNALMALERFISLHPGNDKIDYAYYLTAMCYYEQISDVRRDQELTQEALNAFETMIRRFPNSTYRRQAELKRDLAMDHLAGKEMEIGRYYLNRNHINAAMNRFRTVVSDYQTTTHIPEALYRLIEAYLTLGLKEEAVRIAAVLGYNYPGNQWYKRAYDLLDDASREEIINNRSFVDRTVDSIFKPD